jgi:hypothetical protein
MCLSVATVYALEEKHFKEAEGEDILVATVTVT